MDNLDLTKYRKIQPLQISIEAIKYNTVQDFNPDIRMVDPKILFVDDKYQRSPTRMSLNRVKKIIKEWSWAEFKPPIVTEYEDGKLCVLDGQHTAIAAATHPDIKLIPIFVVPTTDIIERAKAFIGHNTNQTRVTEIQLFKARLEAGDEVAISVNMALRGANVKLSTQANLEEKQGMLSCVGTLESVFSRRGLRGLRIVLDVCVASKLAPIKSHYIYAVEDLMFGEGNRDKYDLQGIALTIRNYPYNQFIADIESQSRVNKENRRITASNLIKSRYIKRFGEVDGTSGSNREA